MKDNDYAYKVYYGKFNTKNNSLFLEEYKSAVVGVASEEKIYGTISTILTLIFSVFSFFLSFKTGQLTSIYFFNNEYPKFVPVIIIFIILLSFLLISTMYLATLQKK